MTCFIGDPTCNCKTDWEDGIVPDMTEESPERAEKLEQVLRDVRDFLVDADWESTYPAFKAGRLAAQIEALIDD